MLRILAGTILVATTLAASPLSSVSLQERLAAIAAPAGGRVGVSATILGTVVTWSCDGDGRYPMQSVYKLPIAMAVLHAVDRGDLDLAQRVRVAPDEFVSASQHSPLRDRHPDGVSLDLEAILRLAVAESDGTASDVALRVIGGAPRVMDYLRDLDIDGIQVLDTEKSMGSDNTVQYRNWATPHQAVALLRALHDGRALRPPSRALLLRWMAETGTGQRRIKALLPTGTIVAHKTGSSGTVGGIAAATNDIGLVTLPDGRTLALAIFVAESTADYEARERVIAEVARAVWGEAASVAK